MSQMFRGLYINPFTPKNSLIILLTVTLCSFGEFGIGSISNPIIEIFILITCVHDVV